MVRCAPQASTPFIQNIYDGKKMKTQGNQNDIWSCAGSLILPNNWKDANCLGYMAQTALPSLPFPSLPFHFAKFLYVLRIFSASISLLFHHSYTVAHAACEIYTSTTRAIHAPRGWKSCVSSAFTVRLPAGVFEKKVKGKSEPNRAGYFPRSINSRVNTQKAEHARFSTTQLAKLSFIHFYCQTHG